MTIETALAALIGWLITELVARWLPEANRNAIPSIALVISTALVIAIDAIVGTVGGDPLSWHTLRMGAVAGATAIVGHYGGSRMVEGIGFVVEWLADAKAKR